LPKNEKENYYIEMLNAKVRIVFKSGKEKAKRNLWVKSIRPHGSTANLIDAATFFNISLGFSSHNR
jgi:hypothetical protein